MSMSGRIIPVSQAEQERDEIPLAWTRANVKLSHVWLRARREVTHDRDVAQEFSNKLALLTELAAEVAGEASLLQSLQERACASMDAKVKTMNQLQRDLARLMPHYPHLP